MPAYATDAPPGLHTLLADLPLPAPLAVAPLDSLGRVLLALQASAGDAAVVVDPESRAPLGVLTLRETVAAVVEGAVGLEEPVVGAMTGGMPCLPADATVQQATVLMVRRGLRHLLLVAADGSFVNLVSRGELYGLRAAGSERVVQGLLATRDIAELAAAAGEVRAFAARRLAEGVGPEALCPWISALNDIVTVHAIDLVEGATDLPVIPWCWLVFGSEGRLEQTPTTDQDNGIIFEADSAAHAAELRRAFVPFAQAVNRALDACGFPLCQGGIMAGNPAWCLSLEEWRRTFAGWIGTTAPKALLNATIFFDFRPLYGREDLAAALRQWLLGRIGRNSAFLRAMAANALESSPPLGLWNRFRYDGNREHPRTLDLKMQGSRFFVDAARIFALAHGIPHTNTVERLRGARLALGMPVEETAAAVEAFYQIQRLRLAGHLSGGRPGAANRVNPAGLHDLDRHILREALRHARRLQQRVSLDFPPP
ncbi:MAG: nucleotidyltransferase [Rhodocyclaceae bacterium]|nr:nucleotidyltransferase [Rhodocyclaceae bacterium]